MVNWQGKICQCLKIPICKGNKKIVSLKYKITCATHQPSKCVRIAQILRAIEESRSWGRYKRYHAMHQLSIYIEFFQILGAVEESRSWSITCVLKKRAGVGADTKGERGESGGLGHKLLSASRHCTLGEQSTAFVKRF